MPKKYIIYCTLLLSALVYANANGYVYGSILSGQDAAQKSANRYHK